MICAAICFIAKCVDNRGSAVDLPTSVLEPASAEPAPVDDRAYDDDRIVVRGPA